MTDTERLRRILDDGCCARYIESILRVFLREYGDDISASRVSHMIDMLNHSLAEKTERLENAQQIAVERANCIKIYLSGDMWSSEEAARANLQPQIENAQAIIDVCKS